MKVLLVSPYYHYPYCLGWYCNHALQKLGHQVKIFDYRLGVTEPAPAGQKAPGLVEKLLRVPRGTRISRIKSMNRSLLSTVEAFNPDLILVQKGELIFPETVAELKCVSRAYTVVWHGDSPFGVQTSTAQIVRSLQFFDLCLVFDPYYLPAMKRAGARNVAHLPFGCDPEVHRTVELSEEEKSLYGSDLVFIGNSQGVYSPRSQVLAQLNALDLRIWGRGWKESSDSRLRRLATGRRARGVEMAKVYSACKIAINVEHEQSVYGTNMRLFEATACGVLLLTENLSQVHDYFKDVEEIVTFQDVIDLRNKIAHYIGNAELRNKIAKAGQHRAHSEHTYMQRMETLLEMVKGL
jgi:spore maturation protein CgeB